MEKERNGIDKYNVADEWSCKGGFEQMRGDYRAVRVRDEDESAPAVVLNDCMNFMDHDILFEDRVGYTGTYGHNLECDYPDSCIISTMLFRLIQVANEIGIRVEPNTNPVDEQNRQPSLGRMWPMPIREMLGRRTVSGE